MRGYSHPRRRLVQDQLLRFALVGIVCLLTLADVGFAQTQRQKKKPKPPKAVAALIDVDRTAIGALLETELLDEKGITWVERTDLDRILGEQKLQLLFAPESGSERAKFGQLLKADLLILLRSVKKEELETIEIAVSEVSRGLRLASRTVPLTGDSAADVQTLLEISRAGIAKQKIELEAIYAVPPFLSKDLLYEHHDLRKTYARLIEQQLLSQPQILVVEFAEAEALMRERVIDARDEKVRRLLPHYLLGEYRNEGKEDERKVKITITHKQGEEELASIKGETIPNEAPKFLQKSVAEIIEQQTGKPSVPPDPKREAAQLLLRAKEYLTLGDYEDAAALAEASLLLEPEQIEPHVVAIRALTPLVEKHWWNGQNNIEESKIAMSHYLRGVDHLIGFYREGGNEDDYLETGQTTFIPMFMSATNGLSIHVKNDELAEIKNFMTEIHIRNRAAMLTLFELRIGHDHRAASGFLGWACVGLNDNETEDLRIEMILKHQDRPDISQIVHTLSTAGTTIDRLDTPLGRKLLEELEKHGNDSVKKTVAQLRIERDEYIARYEAELKKPVAKMALDPVPPGEPHVGFEPISFDWTDSNNASGELKGANGWLATEAGFDVVCSGNSLFLMRERGKLRRVWTADSINSYISRTEHNAAQSDFCYDGRYVWFTFTERLKDGRLFLCDPESEKVHELTAKHGLPNPNEGKTDVQRVYQKLSLAPVGPGKIMLAGYFGRAWIAMVTYDEENDGEVKVFHEAVEVEDRADADQWRSNLIRFSPSYMRALNVYDDGLNLDSRKILIYRGAEHPDAGDHPLVIDPETFNVEVMEQRILSGFNFDVRNGIIYMVYPAPPNYESLALFRVGLPGPTVEPILPVKFSGHVVADKEKIHIVGKQWWIADLEEKTVTPAGPVPWIYNSSFAVDYSKIEIFDGVKIQLDFLARSNHYGIIAVYRNTVDMQTTSQVTFTK